MASGKVPKPLGVPGESEFRGKGVAYCATCDAPLFRGKRVAVIKGGNSALDAALQLGQLAREVYLLTLEDRLGGDEIRRRAVLDHARIKVYYRAVVLAIRGEKFVIGIDFQVDGDRRSLEVEGVFVEIGSVPSTDFLPPEVELQPEGGGGGGFQQPHHAPRSLRCRRRHQRPGEADHHRRRRGCQSRPLRLFLPP